MTPDQTERLLVALEKIAAMLETIEHKIPERIAHIPNKHR